MLTRVRWVYALRTMSEALGLAISCAALEGSDEYFLHTTNEAPVLGFS